MVLSLSFFIFYFDYFAFETWKLFHSWFLHCWGTFLMSCSFNTWIVMCNIFYVSYWSQFPIFILSLECENTDHYYHIGGFCRDYYDTIIKNDIGFIVRIASTHICHGWFVWIFHKLTELLHKTSRLKDSFINSWPRKYMNLLEKWTCKVS